MGVIPTTNEIGMILRSCERFFSLKCLHPGIPTTIKTMGVNITTIVYLRVLIIEIGSTIVLMVVEAQGSGCQHVLLEISWKTSRMGFQTPSNHVSTRVMTGTPKSAPQKTKLTHMRFGMTGRLGCLGRRKNILGGFNPSENICIYTNCWCRG